MPHLIESFVYSGRAMVRGQEVEVPKQKFTVIEFCPYEPSAYVHSPYFYVEGADGKEYEIDAGDFDEYEGRCSDCQQEHAKGECHFDQDELPSD